MVSQFKESGNPDLNRIINGFNTPKEPMEAECNDCPIEFATCKPKKCAKNCSPQCNGNSEVEQLIDISSDQEMDTSDDDSENEIFHPISVERRNDDGLNSVPKDDKPLLLTDDHAKNCETISLAVTPQISFSNVLQDDDVYAKFFSELLRK
ncbi:unnamed protein product [Cercopithifilaria johnstoni]|uniref:Uncharacterized protein n=1 Tax=Cercopithifilaria johnstoni TaxID=2874296 RepID=A0A8J2MKJ4_9BILA|nr:unnamed protein product [Cercopithifilaria johnstoni]